MASQDEGRFNRSLAEENLQLRQEISNLHVQLELQSQTTDRDITGERDRLRRRALELTQREQSILQKEQEVDQWHEEAAQLRREAERKLMRWNVCCSQNRSILMSWKSHRNESKVVKWNWMMCNV